MAMYLSNGGVVLWPLLLAAAFATPGGRGAAADDGSPHRRGDVSRNPETGGLENVLVEVDPALESSQCRQILSALKVRRTLQKCHIVLH